MEQSISNVLVSSKKGHPRLSRKVTDSGSYSAYYPSSTDFESSAESDSSNEIVEYVRDSDCEPPDERGGIMPQDCDHQDTPGVCNIVNVAGGGPVHVGHQYHIHFDRNLVTVLEEGGTVLVDLPENVKIRIAIVGPDKPVQQAMENQILRNISTPDEDPGGESLLSRILGTVYAYSWGLLNVYQIRRGCIEIVLVSKSADAIKQFKQRVRAGEIDAKLKELLITENVRQLANGADFEVKFEIVEDEVDEHNMVPDVDSLSDKEWTRQLVELIKKSDVTKVFRMFSGSRPRTANQKDKNGVFLVTYAAESGCVEVLQLLVRKGGDVKVMHPRTYETLLHCAVSSGSIRMVEYVLHFSQTDGPFEDLYASVASEPCQKSLIDINAFMSRDETALQVAAKNGSFKIVEFLLKSGASSLILDRSGTLFRADYERIQALIECDRRSRADMVMACIENDDLAQLKKLWQAPYDHSLRNKLSETPLMYACKCSRADVVEFLLQSAVYECRETMETPPFITEMINCKEPDRTTDDSIFIRGLKSDGNVLVSPIGSVDSGLVLDEGEPVVCISHVRSVDRSGCTALHYAIRVGDGSTSVDIGRQLLAKDPSILNKQDRMGRTVLHIACQVSRKNIAKVLLGQKHVNVNLKDCVDWLPDELSMKKGSSVVKMIQNVRAKGPKDVFSDKTSTAHEQENGITEDNHCTGILSRYLDDYNEMDSINDHLSFNNRGLNEDEGIGFPSK